MLCLTTNVEAQDVTYNDTTDIEVQEAQKRPYTYRVHRYRERWANFIPTHIKLQYAGNMGFLSVGFGWDYGKQNQWETDVLLGYLPKYDSDRAKLTFSLKQNYIPWCKKIGNSLFDIEPLTCGLYMNTVFGDEFWTNEPDRYPKGYYGFSSRIRFHIFAGQRLTLNIPQHRRYFAKQITLFYEFSTSDLYLVSAIPNKYLTPKDYLCFSLGLKLQLM